VCLAHHRLVVGSVLIAILVLVAVLVLRSAPQPPTVDWLILHALPAGTPGPDGSISIEQVEYGGAEWDCVLRPEPVTAEQPFGYRSSCERSK
jgi:hypothetical protein